MLSRKVKLRCAFCLAALTISFVFNGKLYLNQKAFRQKLKEDGIMTQAYVKLLSSKDAPWYYGTSAEMIYFTTLNGDTIKWMTKSGINVTIDVYLPLEKVIYNRNTPTIYMLQKEFDEYSDSVQIKFLYFSIPFMAICLLMLVWIVKVAIDYRTGKALNTD